jgi:hypothetical protein
MAIQYIPKLYACVLSIRSSILDLFDETDKSLTEAKSIKTGKYLDMYFNNYRKDKLLKDSFMAFISSIIKYIKSNPNYDVSENYIRLIILLSIIIDQYKTTVFINKKGETNLTHFTPEGIAIIQSSDFTILNEIYREMSSEIF